MNASTIYFSFGFLLFLSAANALPKKSTPKPSKEERLCAERVPKKEVKLVCLAKDAEYRVIKDNMKDIESNTKDIPALDNVNFGNLNCMEPKAFSDMEKSKKDEMKKDTYEMKINLKFLSPISDCTTPATVVETTAPTN